MISLSAALFATWLLLSGHYSPLIIGFGAASSIVVVAICQRMDAVDHEGHPIQLGPGAVWYWIWLAYQIAKCNLEVAWLIVSPSRGADPRIQLPTAPRPRPTPLWQSVSSRNALSQNGLSQHGYGNIDESEESVDIRGNIVLY